MEPPELNAKDVEVLEVAELQTQASSQTDTYEAQRAFAKAHKVEAAQKLVDKANNDNKVLKHMNKEKPKTGKGRGRGRGRGRGAQVTDASTDVACEPVAEPPADVPSQPVAAAPADVPAEPSDTQLAPKAKSKAAAKKKAGKENEAAGNSGEQDEGQKKAQPDLGALWALKVPSHQGRCLCACSVGVKRSSNLKFSGQALSSLALRSPICKQLGFRSRAAQVPRSPSRFSRQRIWRTKALSAF